MLSQVKFVEDGVMEMPEGTVCAVMLPWTGVMVLHASAGPPVIRARAATNTLIKTANNSFMFQSNKHKQHKTTKLDYCSGKRSTCITELLLLTVVKRYKIE